MTRTIHSSQGGVVGHRINAGRMGETERALAVSAPRVAVSYFCVNLHEVRPVFSITAKIPEAWPCPKCGQPAGQDKGDPPPPERYRLMRFGQERSHLDYVRQRRSQADGEALIDWAIDRLNERRQACRVRRTQVTPSIADATS